MAACVVHEGYLHKQSQHLKLWKIRYFVLTTTALLYSKKSGRKPKATYALQHLDALTDQNLVVHDHNFVLELRYKKLRLYVSAPTEADRAKWVHLIKNCKDSLSVGADTTSEASLNTIERKPSESEPLSVRSGIPESLRRRFLASTTKERRDERKAGRLPKLRTSFTEAWLEDEVRGRAWAALLGNKLQINEQLFEICKTRAKAVLVEVAATKAKDMRPNRPSLTIDTSGLDGGFVVVTSPQHAKSTLTEALIADNERNIKLVKLDMPRTFGSHPQFQAGAVGAQKTYEVLEAYTCYRPDLGYVQGMSYLAAILCLHMDSFSAFKAMVSLLSTRLLFDMYRLEEDRTLHYLGVYDTILQHELPTLHAYFEEIGMDAKMYVVDWAFTLFTRCVPLDVVLRIWDVYILLGTPFFFQACMAILILYEEHLLVLDLGDAMRFLHDIPKSTSPSDFFDALDAVNLSCSAIDSLLAGGNVRPWSPVGRRPVSVEFPDAYEY
ncbi:hypothetical protein SPRG_21393 [Saprolegnia parasitica CBS 223.65]|uniref:Rab-GAP TBC domain-containing protein n=1 Tax=Saprolegnia parasitica (strain CBS 223.65) TaxID=695850 RepID=A0A067BUI2_SAPPC|nr:hypothetical protein SPRG_21393 [Saprolegnia parasitica CBS 223.65]KDO20505.1 hypothetical protein SPRG_21393 [Saprolegnia parasitica CBS 223.65]|eukprot:XP_012208791.1 hypothetical protein SPRG_21393 [Saprolegnia parasitica CBS 223.65]